MTERIRINITDDDCIYKEILKPGTGDECPLTGCRISMDYIAKQTDGTIYDSSYERKEPLEFILGKGQVMKPFDLAIATMKLGEKCSLTCPAKYAYGVTAGSSTIPTNDETLTYEIELLEWKGEDLSPNQDDSIERFILKKSEQKKTPNYGALVKVHLTGSFNGKIFDERDVQFDYSEGRENRISEGVEIAIGRMAVGEIAKVKINSKYAFGKTGDELFNIPPNADVEYNIHLIESIDSTEDWCISTKERLQQATFYKEKGTAYYEKQNFALALKMYEKCIEALPEKNLDEVLQLQIAAKNNMALCYQKTKAYHKGKKICNEILRLDENNIKALYRRGVCNLELNEFTDACADFEKVLKLDPQNKAAANQLKISKEKILEHKGKELKIYANMFSKQMEVNPTRPNT